MMALLPDSTLSLAILVRKEVCNLEGEGVIVKRWRKKKKKVGIFGKGENEEGLNMLESDNIFGQVWLFILEKGKGALVS